MNGVIIAISGRIGSGKSTVSKELAKTLGWRLAGFGDFVRLLAKEKGLPQTRESLQNLGAELVGSDCGSFCRDFLEYAEWDRNRYLIFDGVRHMSVLNTLKELLRPRRLLLVFIDVKEEDLHERRALGAEGSYADSRYIDSHSTEVEVETNLKTAADLQVDGRKNPESIVAEIQEWLDRIE